jgi:hypothetical protein
MSGNSLGALKKKLGLKGTTKPGEMIARMNALKNGKIEKPTKKVAKIIKKII